MKKKKKTPFTLLLYLLICVFIILGPIYLLRNNPDQQELKDDQKGNTWKGVITLWDYPRLDSRTGTRYGWMANKIKEFERKNPGVYIDFKPLDSKTGPIELETALLTETYPDIAPVGNDYGIIAKNILEPLNDHVDKDYWDDFKTQALSSVRHHDRVWGFPLMMTNYTMFLNLDLFHERGVMPPKDGNWSYDEFVEVTKALTWDRDGDGKNDVYGFHSFIDLNEYNTWGILLSDGAEIFKGNSLKYSFYDEKAISGLKKLVDLKQLHEVTPKDFGENSEQSAWELFSKQKKVAVYPTGTWAINVLNQLKNEGHGFEFAVANYPIGEKGVPVSMAKSVVAYGIFKQEDERKLQMCIDFLKFLSQDQYQKELNRLGMFPVKKSAGEIYENDRFMHIIEKSLAYTETMPAHPEWLTIDGLLQSQIRQALLGHKSVEEALKDAEEKINIYLQNTNN